MALLDPLKALPGNAARTALVLGGFALFLTWEQSFYWRTEDEYSFGWLVPLFVAFILSERWEKIKGYFNGLKLDGLTPVKRARAEEELTLGFPALAGLGNGPGFLEGLATAAILTGLVSFLIGAVLRAAFGAQPDISFLMSGGFVLMAVAMLFQASSGEGKTEPLHRRLAFLAVFTFPIFIWLLSAPLVEFVDRTIRLFLMDVVTMWVVFAADMIDLGLHNEGNTLVLDNGARLQVEDACSGIRSLTACLFAGSFMAAVFLKTFPRKAGLVLTAMGLATATNFMRSLFLTIWSNDRGPGAIEFDFSGHAPHLLDKAGHKILDAAGQPTPNPDFWMSVHDVAGFAVLGLTLVGLFCLLPVFNFTLRLPEEEPTVPPSEPNPDSTTTEPTVP